MFYISLYIFTVKINKSYSSQVNTADRLWNWVTTKWHVKCKIYNVLTGEIFLSGMRFVKMCSHDEVFVSSLKIWYL